MPVTILFDNVKEMEAFLDGRLNVKTVTTKRGRKPAAKKATAAKKTTAKKAVGRPKATTAKKATAKKAVGRPKATTAKKATAKKAVGRSKATTAKKATAKKAVSRPKATAAKRTTAKKIAATPKKRTGMTLTGKIQESINKRISSKQEFTANDIFSEIAKKDKAANKQSVITSVLKQMKTTYKAVKVGEKPGNGPRPVKVYKP